MKEAAVDQVQALLKRPALYDNIDGSGELVLGLCALGFSLFGWLNLHAPAGSIWHGMYGLFLFAGVMQVVIYLVHKGIKSRITYRRTGFVAYRTGKTWVVMAVAVVVSALASAGLFMASRRHWDLSVPVLLLGLAMAAGYIRMIGAVRWKWAMCTIYVDAVLTIAVLPADLVEAFANHRSLSPLLTAKALGAYWLTFLAFGAVLVISGSISLWLYIHRTQALAQEA
jgi:hypothetical protein